MLGVQRGAGFACWQERHGAEHLWLLEHPCDLRDGTPPLVTPTERRVTHSLTRTWHVNAWHLWGQRSVWEPLFWGVVVGYAGGRVATAGRGRRGAARQRQGKR